jgi:hypothetical protein
MKLRFATGLAALLFAGTVAMAAGDSSWTGYITDAKCGAKAAHEGASQCTIKCVKDGERLVFVDDADKKVYAIADQTKAVDHAGQHVTVKGTVDGDTLKLSSIHVAPVKSN